MIFYCEIMKRKQLCHRNLCVYFPRYSLVFFAPVRVNNPLPPPITTIFYICKIYFHISRHILSFVLIWDKNSPELYKSAWSLLGVQPTFSFYLCRGCDSIVLSCLFICLYFIYYLNPLRARIISSSFLNPYI